MFTAWNTPQSRSTMDIDLLGRLDREPNRVITAIQEICDQEVEKDGLAFDSNSAVSEAITAAAKYEGVRVRLRGTLGTAKVVIQIDIGFGDPVVPGAIHLEYPTILDFPAPRLRGYSRESLIAEKFHALTFRGALNSRVKDFFDIWLLSRQCGFEGGLLATAIVKTFGHRETPIQAEPTGLTVEFASDAGMQAQWRGFLQKSRLTDAPRQFTEVVADLSTFLAPVASALATGTPFRGSWAPGGPWTGTAPNE